MSVERNTPIEKMNKNIVVFEIVNPSSKNRVINFLNNRFIVYYFTIDKRVLHDPCICKGIEERKLVNIIAKTTNSISYLDGAVLSHRYLMDIFRKRYANTSSIKNATRLFGTEYIQDTYKKEILSTLSKIFENILRIRIIVEEAKSPVFFYIDERNELYQESASCLNFHLEIIVLSGQFSIFKRIQSRVQAYTAMFYPWNIFFCKTKLIPRHKKTDRHYSVCINANLPSLLTINYHYIEFLLNKKYGERKDQIIFIDETNKGVFSNDFKENGFPVFDFFHNRERLSISFYGKILSKFLPAWFFGMIYALTEDLPLIEANRKVFSDYMKWNIFFDCCSPDKSVTILLPDNTSKNLIFSKNACKTIFIYPDNSAADYVSGYPETIPIATIHTFMNYDFAIVYGNKIMRYFSNNVNRIKTYCPLGVPAAQIIQEIKVGCKATRLPTLIKEKGLSGKIIGVFDNSYVDYGHVKIKDGVRFGNEILRLLDEMPEISIIFKEKKARSITPALNQVYEQLEQHPRCLMIKKTGNDTIFSTDVIAASDMVISVGYTSTNAEALSAGIKAIYYDAAGTDLGKQFYFNNYPNFVAHEYSELVHLVRYWLYDCSEKDFRMFLNQYVKNEIDPYMDMNAINRLQNFINDGKS